ncbi:MAG TPA: ribosome biogenesis GTP-binding protein YihA/YsxC [Prolixibacteraceae bacterium]|nr:ribosome biogenesis GTP-binding protein YihA/YsxC [Prolixibacteraceae bacterium]
MIKQARFLCSNTEVAKCPAPDKPEYAFIGRSNVGKSSLINMLVGQNSLAKVSVRPGKTQLINHFIIDESWYLVDLPGYGYAKVSMTMKEKFQKIISNYIRRRENLYCLFVLIDVRHEPQKIDVEFITWLGENQVPFAIIFTKADKLGKVSVSKNVEAYKKELKKLWEELPPILVSSAEDGTGREEIISFIENINNS